MTTKQLPKVAVLLAAYNGEKYIKDQITSILNQNNVRVDIFISIDSSTDNTVEICRELKNKNKNIFIINEKDKVFGSAGENFYFLIKNINFQNYDYIAFSDQDDLWKDDKLYRGIKKIIAGNFDAYSSNVECFWDDVNNTKLIIKSQPQREYDYYFEAAGPGCTYILSKNLIIAFQNFLFNLKSRPFHHDWFIYAYARYNHYAWHIDDYSSLLYRQHNSNQVGANKGIKQKIKRLNLIRNGSFKGDVYKILETLPPNFKKIGSLRYEVIKCPFRFRRNKKDAFALLIFALLGFI